MILGFTIEQHTPCVCVGILVVIVVINSTKIRHYSNIHKFSEYFVQPYSQ